MPKHLTLLLLLASFLLADTANYTWDTTNWNTPWTLFEGGTSCDTSYSFSYVTTGCNSNSACRQTSCHGRNDTYTPFIRWDGTWEDLGVTPGNVVSSVQMTDAATKADQNSASYCDTNTMGPLSLRDGSSTLVSTLWSGRTAASGSESSWTNEGSQTAQGCGSVCASDATIRFHIEATIDTANDKNAICSFFIDDLDIQIIHSTPSASSSRLLITKVKFKGGKDGKIHPHVLSTVPIGAGGK